jgi:hypothetical protein
MSLIGSLLGLVLIPLKAKPKQPPKEEDNLTVLALAKELNCMQFALNHWRDSGHALWEENQRLREDLRAARDERDLVRAELRELMVQKDPTSPYYRRRGLAALDMTSPNYHAQLERYGQMAWGDCACIPSRGQALNRDQAE